MSGMDADTDQSQSGTGSSMISTSADDSEYSGSGLFAFDSTLADEAVQAIKHHERQPLPLSEQPPGSNPPTGTCGNGLWNFTRYIPEWTAPDWNDESVITITEQGKPTKVFRRDYMQTIRPAVLPRDASRYPTPYARRYGIHPDEPGGRSKASPVRSNTRQVALSRAQQTSTGVKDYVDQSDLMNEIQRLGGGSTRKFLDEVAKLSEHDAQHEYIFALRRLSDIIEDDMDYQRVMFSDMTTDEVRGRRPPWRLLGGLDRNDKTDTLTENLAQDSLLGSHGCATVRSCWRPSPAGIPHAWRKAHRLTRWFYA